jgi:hypothetical protein
VTFDRGDRAQIKQLQLKYYVSDQDIEAAGARARELVVFHWEKIEAVATALLDKKTLSGIEIDAAHGSRPGLRRFRGPTSGPICRPTRKEAASHQSRVINRS